MTRAWDQLAARWHGRSDPPGSLPERLHARLRERVLQRLQQLPQGAAVLDLGCGRGDLANELARRRPDLKVLGLDASPVMLALAKAAAPSPDNPEWLQADATHWPLPDASLDAVASLDLIAHLEPIAQAPALLREAGRVCRGRLYLEVKNAFSLRAILGLRRLLGPAGRLRALRDWAFGLEAEQEPIPIHVHRAAQLLPLASRAGRLRLWPLLPAPTCVHVVECPALRAEIR